MAHHLIHFSKNLRGYADINLYLPVGTEYEDMIEPGEKFQTLWILHGGAGNFTEWAEYSAIEKLAMLNKFAVVMPDGDNSMFNDKPDGMNYYTYLTEELPAFLRKHFPLSDKREDNFICGLSMGGFGAAKAGFACPEKYSAVGIFSSGPADLLGDFMKGGPADNGFVFKPGDLEPGTPNDIWGNFLRLRDSGYPMPVIYDAVGRSDFLLPQFELFRQFARDNGMEDCVRFETFEGVHCWDVWDEAVHAFVDMLPLKGRGIWRKWYNGRRPEAR